MKNDMKFALTGALVATAVAGLFLGGCKTAQTAQGSGGGMVMCNGVNACKGKAACKTATHDCAGKNACKGKGWIKLSKSDCESKGGKAMAMKMK